MSDWVLPGNSERMKHTSSTTHRNTTSHLLWLLQQQNERIAIKTVSTHAPCGQDNYPRDLKGCTWQYILHPNDDNISLTRVNSPWYLGCKQNHPPCIRKKQHNGQRERASIEREKMIALVSAARLSARFVLRPPSVIICTSSFAGRVMTGLRGVFIRQTKSAHIARSTERERLELWESKTRHRGEL